MFVNFLSEKIKHKAREKLLGHPNGVSKLPIRASIKKFNTNEGSNRYANLENLTKFLNTKCEISFGDILII